MGKSALKSKTLWVNWTIFVLTCVVLILDAVTNGAVTLPVQVDGAVIALVLSLLNVVLRYLTTEPIHS